MPALPLATTIQQLFFFFSNFLSYILESSSRNDPLETVIEPHSLRLKCQERLKS